MLGSSPPSQQYLEPVGARINDIFIYIIICICMYVCIYQGRIKSGRNRVASSRIGSDRIKSGRFTQGSHRFALFPYRISTLPFFLMSMRTTPGLIRSAWWNAQLGPNVGYSSINSSSSSSSNIINVSNASRDIYYQGLR